MDWSIAVNDILHSEITKLNHTLVPPGFHGDVRAMRSMQESLSKLIDVMGEQSAAAQGLNRVITTAEKLRNSPSHTLYLYKDYSAKGGQGEVIGLLKVGYKHLFLFDERDHVREVEPLCVLDFYIVRDRQRHGHGRVLFDYMLHDTELNAHELAIDGPSEKMEQFLAKNYGVERLLRQNNNFAVSPRFFDNSEDISNKSGRSTPAVSAAVGRFAAAKPPSAIANVIHGGVSYYEPSNGRPARASDLYDSRHTLNIWRQSLFRPGDSSGARELERGGSPARGEAERAQPLWAPPVHTSGTPPPYWDQDTEETDFELERGRAAAAGRPATLHVEPPAPAPFADLPAAGLPSGATTSPYGAHGPTHTPREQQLTDKGYFDVKYYHNRLW